MDEFWELVAEQIDEFFTWFIEGLTDLFRLS
jgi:hypothetical protein